MSKIEKYLPVEEPNSSKITILKNKNILFQDRKYLEFNCRIRRIKLREPLNEIVIDPNIYLRTSVPENIYMTIVQLHRLRNSPNIIETRDFNIYPTSDNLQQLERKYGDSLTNYDIHCVRKTRKGVKFKGRSKLTLDKSSVLESYMSQSDKQKSLMKRLDFSVGLSLL